LDLHSTNDEVNMIADSIGMLTSFIVTDVLLWGDTGSGFSVTVGVPMKNISSSLEREALNWWLNWLQSQAICFFEINYQLWHCCALSLWPVKT
jgi:hypothetical protein